jgi:hypothetical protein
MPNPGSAPYTPRCNDRAYVNSSDNYQTPYTTVAYTDPIALLGGSTGRWANYTNKNTMWYPIYETPPQFPFRPQPVEITLARVTAEPYVDPNNCTTQLATILRESFGI